MPPKIIWLQFEKVKNLYQELKNTHKTTATTIIEKKVDEIIKELEIKLQTYDVHQEERFLR